MKRAGSPRDDVPIHRPPPQHDAAQLTPLQANAVQADGLAAPALRHPSPPAQDFLASLPPEVRSTMFGALATRADRINTATTSLDNYATWHPVRNTEFFVTHCHQIAALPAAQIVRFQASELSQPLLDAMPGSATLISLFKLHCLLEKDPTAATPLLDQLRQTSRDELCTAFQLAQDVSRLFRSSRDLSMPFLSDDFLARPAVLDRVQELAAQEPAPTTAIALTEALLSCAELSGKGHLIAAFDSHVPLPLPQAWRALGQLTQQLVRHGETHPDDVHITPTLLLRLAGWCHFVQESGLLLPELPFNDHYDEFRSFGVERCVALLLTKLAQTRQRSDDNAPQHMAPHVLAWQKHGLQAMPAGFPHLGSVRLFSALMHSADAAIRAGTPEGVQLLNYVADGLMREIDLLNAIAGQTPIPGFGAYDPDTMMPDSEDESEPEENDLAGWDATGDLIHVHAARDQPLPPALELEHKLYGLQHDPVEDLTGEFAPIQLCQLRIIDSVVATYRELCLRTAALPEPARQPIVDALRELASAWPVAGHQDDLDSWIP